MAGVGASGFDTGNVHLRAGFFLFRTAQALNLDMRSVVITSANGATAGLLIPLLRAKGYHTVGLIRREAAIGTDETVTDWMGAAGAGGEAGAALSNAARHALAGADIIIHLSGDANAKNKAAYREANYTTTRLVADAIRGNGKKQRIVYLSYANASVKKKNLYLRYKGEAEKLLMDTGKEVVIFRCPVIVDAPGTASKMDELFIARKGKAVPVIGNGLLKMRPVYRGDVARVVVAALEKGRPGIYELSGPEEMSLNSFIRLANRDEDVKMRHIPGWMAFVLSYIIPGLSSTFVDLMLHHTASVYDPATYREFGAAPTSIIQIWGRGMDDRG